MVQHGKLRPDAVIDDRFVLRRRLGSGSTGVVWRAEDSETGTDVALKILHPKMSHDAMAIAQLGREADVLQQLDHDNIARSFAFQPNGPFVYLAMEFVDGQPLNQVIGQHTSDQKYFRHHTVLRMFEQLCSAVSYAHSKYIVHRDLKPHNVMVIGEGDDVQIKVLDFGIARLLEGSIFDATTLGRQLGSLFYMSPEQTRGEPADVRSDVFALGTILFELLTLRRTWAWDEEGDPIPAFERPVPHGEANAMVAVFTRLTSDERPRVSEARLEIPPAFDAIITRALAIEREDRYASVALFAEEAIAALRRLTGTIDAPTELAMAVSFDGPTRTEYEETALVRKAADDSLGGPTVIGLEFLGRSSGEQRTIPETLEYESSHDTDGALDAPGPTVRASVPIPTGSDHGLGASPVPSDDVRQTIPPPRMNRTPAIELPPKSDPPPPFQREPPPSVTPNSPTAPTPSARPSTPTIGLILGIIMAAFAIAILVGTLIFRREQPLTVTPIAPKPIKRPMIRYPALWAQLEAVKANPADNAARQKMLVAIGEAADGIADKKEAESIVGCANGNSMMMNVQGLENCLRRLEQAPRAP